MFKFLIFSTLLGFSILNANEDLQPRSGIISSSGVTFATLENMNEGILRGAGHEKNPFVHNVCRIFYSTESGYDAATITQIAPQIFLGCKHTIRGIYESLAYFQKGSKFHEFELRVESGNNLLRGVIEIVPYFHRDEAVDLALVKLSFNQGVIYPCEFLQIASASKKGEVANGYVVSCAEVSHIGNISLTNQPNIQRSLSIHRFQKKNQDFISNISGKVSANQEALMTEACMQYYLSQSHENRKKLKEVTGVAILEFPSSNKEQLMCTMGVGASGSPLVVKQDGIFKLIGMLQKGAALPRSIIDGVLSKEIARDVEYINNFIDLTVHAEWIVRGIQRLSTSIL